MSGQLFLVSLGVGDPENLTLRARDVLLKADVLLGSETDRGQFPEIFQDRPIHEAGHGLFTPMFRRHASEEEAQAFEARVRTLVRHSVREGKTVAVVSYGDPTLYGPRVGYLHEFRDLQPVVIPGISAFNAANAALACAVTQGGGTQSVVLAPAKNANTQYDGRDTLAEIGKGRPTLALFTMKMQLPQVVEQLRRNYPDETPVALVCHAGRQETQTVIRSTVGGLLDLSVAQPLPFECMMYVGEFLRADHCAPSGMWR